MGIHSKIFTATDAITHEPFTILVESINPKDGEPFVVIKALEGEYRTREAFQEEREYSLQGLERGCSDKREIKLYRSISMTRSNARQFFDSINEVLAASEES